MNVTQLINDGGKNYLTLLATYHRSLSCDVPEGAILTYKKVGKY